MNNCKNDPVFQKIYLAQSKILVRLLFCMSVMVSLIACTQATPTPNVLLEQPTETTFLPKNFLPLIFAQKETVSLAQITSQPDLTETNTPASTDTLRPFTDTPTSCSPPTAWVAYAVQPGDTLFALAQKTNTTVAEIQRLNCMDGATTIIVGQALYLPMLPPTNTPVPPTHTPLPPTSTFTPKPESPSPTNTPDRPDIVLAPGGGNNPDFVPCKEIKNEPWIDVENPLIEIGQRRYFFACEFANAIQSATVTWGNGQSENLAILTTMPNPALQQGNATALVAWSAFPKYPLDTAYALTFTDTEGIYNAEPKQFLMTMPTRQYILAVPPVNSPGGSFEIYYINFDFASTLEIDYYQEILLENKIYTFSYLTSWEVTINNALGNGQGWEMLPLNTSSSDSLQAYLVGYQLNPNQQFCVTCTIFWLK